MSKKIASHQKLLVRAISAVVFSALALLSFIYVGPFSGFGLLLVFALVLTCDLERESRDPVNIFRGRAPEVSAFVLLGAGYLLTNNIRKAGEKKHSNESNQLHKDPGIS